MSNLIIMYYGSSCPGGWSECNGSNGTPDLRGLFIAGENKDYPNIRMNIENGVNNRTSSFGHDHIVPDHEHDLTLNVGQSTSANSSTNPGSDDVGKNHTDSTSTTTIATTNSETASASNMHPFFGIIYCKKND